MIGRTLSLSGTVQPHKEMSLRLGGGDGRGENVTRKEVCHIEGLKDPSLSGDLGG